MKSVQLIAIVALSAILMSFGESKKQFSIPVITNEGGGLVWKSEEIDLGSIPRGKPVTVQFEFTNKGTELAIIEKVTTSCGCTEADFLKKPIEKNMKAFISVTYNAANSGAFSKAITVLLVNDKSKVLYIKGTVI